MSKKILAAMLIGILSLSSIGCNLNNTQIKSNEDNDIVKSSSEMEVSYIDVDDGDATLIQVDGKNFLIDSGNDTYVTKVVDYLNSKGVKKLDYVIGSNYYYIGGMSKIIDKFEIGEFYLPACLDDYDKEERKKIEDKAKSKNLMINGIKGGDDLGINIENTTIDIFAPIKNDDSEYNSVVMKISYGENSFLFTGSINQKIENELIEADINLKANVLKVSNRGSEKGTSKRFVKEVNPDIAIISVEKGSNKRPAKETLSVLDGNNSTVYRTDLDGNIVIISDGKSISKKN